MALNFELVVSNQLFSVVLAAYKWFKISASGVGRQHMWQLDNTLLLLAGNLNFKSRIVFGIFFGDLEIWKTHRTFWRKATFSRKKEKKIENGSKHDIRSSLTKMHQVIYNTFFNALDNSFHVWTLHINMYFKLFFTSRPM